MPGELLAPMLPPNVAGDTGWELTEPLEVFGGFLHFAHVPSGQAWLVQSVSCLVNGTGAPGNGNVVLIASNPTQAGGLSVDTIIWQAVSDTIAAADTGQVTFGLGMDQGSSTGLGAFASSAWTAGIPYVVLGPGVLLSCSYQGNVGGAVGIQGKSMLVVTQYDFGGGGGPAPEALGPFMFVPGPTEGVAT